MIFRVLLHIGMCASLCLSLAVSVARAEEAPRVVASIKPLALVAREIMGKRGQVSVLLQPGQTPHNYAFRMSDRQRVDEADVLLWTGAGIEPYLEKISEGKVALALADKSEQSFSGDHHAHEEDTHLWLSIPTVLAVAASLANTLSQMDPDGEHRYRKNLAQLNANLNDLLAAPLSRSEHLGEKPHQPYAVAHRAYGHFLASFPFPEPIVLADSPEVSPGARSLWQSGKQLRPGSCVLIESQNRPKWLNSFVERHQLITLHADILGYSSGVSSYSQMMTELLSRFEECVGRG